MKLLRLFAIAAVVSLAACSSSPTDSVRAGAPSFDGGNMLGTGNYVTEPDTQNPSDGGNGLGSGNFSGDSTSTGRGGNGLGSGN